MTAFSLIITALLTVPSSRAMYHSQLAKFNIDGDTDSNQRKLLTIPPSTTAASNQSFIPNSTQSHIPTTEFTKTNVSIELSENKDAAESGFKLGTKEFWNINNWDLNQWLVVVVLPVLVLIIIIMCLICCICCILQKSNVKPNTVTSNNDSNINNSNANNSSNVSQNSFQTKTRKTISNNHKYDLIPNNDNAHSIPKSQMDDNSVNAALLAAEMTTGVDNDVVAPLKQNHVKQNPSAVEIPMTDINEREESKRSNYTTTTTQSAQEEHEHIDDEKDSDADLWQSYADPDTNNGTTLGNQTPFHNHNHPSVYIPMPNEQQHEKPHIIDNPTPSLPASEPASEGPPLTQTQSKIAWDKHQIAAWVREHGKEFHKYVQKFLDNGINGRGLCYYEDDEEKLKKVIGKVVSDEMHRDQIVVNWMALQ